MNSWVWLVRVQSIQTDGMGKIMTIEHIKKLLSELCYYHKVRITHTFSINQTQFLKVRCLTANTQHTFELAYSSSGRVELINEMDVAVETIQKFIVNTPC